MSGPKIPYDLERLLKNMNKRIEKLERRAARADAAAGRVNPSPPTEDDDPDVA